MHIYVVKLTIIGSDDGLSSDRRQAIIWINAGILLTGSLVTNFNEIFIEIQAFSFENVVPNELKENEISNSCYVWRNFNLCSQSSPYYIYNSNSA